MNIRHDEAPGGLDKGNVPSKRKSKRRSVWNGNGATVISKEGGGPRSRSGEKVGRGTKVRCGLCGGTGQLKNERDFGSVGIIGIV